MEGRQRTSRSTNISSGAIHKCCKCCYTFGMVLAAFLIGIGPVALLTTSVKALGGDTILWHPDVRYYGRILGGVSWAVGTVLLIVCYQVRWGIF